MTESWSLSGDLAQHWVVAALALALASLVLLGLELRRDRRRRGGAVAVTVTGVLALAALVLAVARPVRVEQRGTSVGARVLLLLDGSRSVDLPADDDDTRRQLISRVLPRLAAHLSSVRLEAATFGVGAPLPFAEGGDIGQRSFDAPPVLGSDLSAALESVAAGTDALPQAVVVVSDGRLDRPGAERLEEHLKQAMAGLHVPIHTVGLGTEEPADAAVVSAQMAGAVVAHQPVALSVEIACTGGLGCSDVPVVARELFVDSQPVVRASGVAHLDEGRTTVDLEVVLDRAGQRILEVAIEAPDGDTIADNDHRYLTIEVARDRVRLLHVAGRPTYDVRALRSWLKSDASVDVVAFFILRTHDDKVIASQDELALIPFPVDELFTAHLPSFDAVVLQDFDALPYGLGKHLSSLTRYVERGGGLIMVGGPNAFVQGSYAGTPLAAVLPVSLDGIARDAAVDLASFSPQLTAAGRHAPVLEPLQALIGAEFPEMPGTNVVGDARQGATVLLEHPTATTASGAPMPVLALGEYGSGRTIALTVDGSHRLLFSTFAVEAAGRAHGAFWDALLGWLMRDPRFEPARVLLPGGCIAGEPARLELRAAFVDPGTVAEVVVARMGSGAEVARREARIADAREPVAVDLGRLEAGGYTVTVQLAQQGRAAPSRYDFACEVGGQEWADPRPDPLRLQQIAERTGGVSVTVADVERIPLPRAAEVVAERRIHPLMPPWVWTLLSAVLLGAHWLARRRVGLA